MKTYKQITPEMIQKDIRYLELLSHDFPNLAAASTEIINLEAILNLPKGTEHFLADLHGEYEAFQHVLRNASGAIKRKVNEIFGNNLREMEKNYPDQFIIADAKRGDIGNTSAMYARTFFEELNIDSVTVAPYMGEDSVTPFLTYEGKWVILLALTSNKGSHDFQLTTDTEGERLFEKVLRKSQEWANDQNMMYVVGATQGRMFEDIRKIVPNHFLLVPGIGAQGGSLEEVCKYGMTKECGLIVNSSRAIIYADKTENFANVAAEEAQKVQQQMEKELAAIL